jgi:hypothetical protein
MITQSDGDGTSLQSNMIGESDVHMGRQDLIADTEVQSVCVFNGNNTSSAETY